MRNEVVDEFNENGHLIYSERFIGAFVRGAQREEALQKFPAELAQYCAWRKLPYEPVRTQVVQEKVSTLQICDADSDVLFESEKLPLTTQAYQSLKTLALQSAQDFLRLYTSIPRKTETDLPPRKTFYGTVPATAEEMYVHTKSVNTYYFSEIGVETDNEPDIYTCRLRAFETLEQTPDYLQNKVFHGSWDEDWTLRKLCRRFVWHDRIHARAMYRLAVRLCGKDAVENPFCFE